MRLDPHAKLIALQHHFSQWPGSHTSFPNDPNPEPVQLANAPAAWQQFLELDDLPDEELPDGFLIWQPFEDFDLERLTDSVESLAIAIQAAFNAQRLPLILFMALDVGDCFQDSRTGEWWEKRGDGLAYGLSGDFTGDFDEFRPDELVHFLPAHSAALVMERLYNPTGGQHWIGLPYRVWLEKVNAGDTQLGYWQMAAEINTRLADPQFQSWAAGVLYELFRLGGLTAEQPDYLWLEAYEQDTAAEAFAATLDALQRG